MRLGRVLLALARRWRAGRVLVVVFVVSVALIGVLTLSGASASARLQAAPPLNTALPSVSGSAAVRQTVSVTTGSWSGTTPIAFAYQWLLCDAHGAGCGLISGQSGSTYAVARKDLGHRLRARLTATNTAGAASADSNATAVVVRSLAPVNTAEPIVSGPLVQGQTLAVTSGSWSGAAPISYAYQWLRCGSDGGAADASNCAVVGAAHGSRYLLVADDVGQRLRVRVTAANSGGSTSVASNATALVKAATLAPKNTTEPSLAGAAVQGQTLTANTGSWSGSQPISFALQWLRCDRHAGNCAPLAGARHSSYRLAAGDVGTRLRVRATASNQAGSASADSNATATVQATAAPPPPLPPGALKLPNGQISIPVTSVSLPDQLIIDAIQFAPNPVSTRTQPITLRAHVSDAHGYPVRDALLFARSLPLLTTTPNEQQTGEDGWATLQFLPQPDFPLANGHNVQFFLRARKQGENTLAGVSARRLIQIATHT